MRTRRGLSFISHIEESYKPYSACLKFLRKWFPGCLTTLALANHHLIGPIILAIAQHQITQGSTQTSLSSTSFSVWGRWRGVVNTAKALFVQLLWGNPFWAFPNVSQTCPIYFWLNWILSPKKRPQWTRPTLYVTTVEVKCGAKPS